MEVELTQKAKERKKNYDKDFFSRTDIDNMMLDLRHADNAEKPKIKHDISEKLKILGIKVDSSLSIFDFQEKINIALSDNIFGKAVHTKILKKLYETFQQYAAPKDFLLRLVEAHEPKDKNTQNSIFYNQSLRLRLLKMATIMLLDLPHNSIFRKNYGGLAHVKKCLDNISKESGQDLKTSILWHLEDKIFDDLKEATKDQIKRKGKYGLLRICNNLENGYFDDQTRMDLFFFAVAYQFSTEECIEKLFEEYYINNLLACISEERNNGLLPDGHGIHWKNYQDIVWLYYINWQSQDVDNRSPIETLGKIEEAFIQLKGDMTYRLNHQNHENTDYYANLFSRVRDVKEDQFLDFIKERYDCSGEVKQTASAIQKSKFMQEQLTKDSGFTFVSPYTIKDACCVPGEDDFKKSAKERALNEISFECGCCYCKSEKEHIQKFCKVLYHAVQYITDSKRRNAIPTRMDVFARYHAYYNRNNKGKHKSFSEVWADYTCHITGLDQYLNDANFIPISEKNIIDMCFVLSSYYSMQSDEME